MTLYSEIWIEIKKPGTMMGFIGDDHLGDDSRRQEKKGKKDSGTSNVSHISRKPLQSIDVTIPVGGHVVKVTF